MRRRLGPSLMKILLSLAIGCAAAWTAQASAQAEAGPPLTEKQAVELALERSREIEANEANVEIAKGRLDSAGWIRNPEFRISDIKTSYFTDEFDDIEFGLRWRPPRIGELDEDKQQARVELWERQLTQQIERQELIARVIQTYADVIREDELARLANERVELERERIAIIERMVELGRRSVVYFTKARLWSAESLNDRTRAKERQASARRRLKRLTGAAANVELVEMDVPVVELDLETLTRIAYENRPEVKVVEARRHLAERQYTLERLKNVPWFSYVQLSYHLRDDKDDYGELMMGFDLPLFNWNLGNIRATRQAVERKETQVDAVRERIESQVRNRYNIYRDSLLDWNMFCETAGELVRNAQTIIESAKQHDTLPRDEVLELNLTINETLRIKAQKRKELVVALFDLTLALGLDGPEDIQP